MKTIKTKDFTGTRAWDALNIAEIDGATVRLHWTDEAYKWHINDGEEVFVVLDGKFKMHTRKLEKVETIELMVGDIFHVQKGEEHFAEPIGEARVLVIEKKGSI